MTAGHILITGASSGLGAALARLYAAPGVHLSLWGRNSERLEGVAAQCRGKGAIVEALALDLRDIHAIEAQLERSDEKRPIDIAIFNAGLGGTTPSGRLVESPAHTLDVATTNFTAAVIGANTIAERMARRRGGHIVLISSIADSIPLPMAPTYAGTKAGLKMFAESLRALVKPHGVAVTLIAPGFVDTPMSAAIKTKPFLISADKAAEIMKRGIERRHPEFAYPWSYALMRRLFTKLPRLFQRAIVGRLPPE
jgi:short-subunit dehydrogenase